MTLTPDQHAAAWRSMFRSTLDDLPDREIAWEHARWHWLGVPLVAALCQRMLDERTEADLSIPDGASARNLDALWNHLDPHAVLALSHREAVPLVTAMRVVFWRERQEAGAA